MTADTMRFLPPLLSSAAARCKKGDTVGLEYLRCPPDPQEYTDSSCSRKCSNTQHPILTSFNRLLVQVLGS
ncbi:hypothetical protein E2C01_009148 [Portunus trituberculatus]|uniref:Uncharacterized protein n=1 Tax=Portunus trituberculatus TaxID=210409 RepID=A0A5B7D2P5_PORTR|nr:hypothetical protein [Portunus trituberculatus]